MMLHHTLLMKLFQNWTWPYVQVHLHYKDFSGTAILANSSCWNTVGIGKKMSFIYSRISASSRAINLPERQKDLSQCISLLLGMLFQILCQFPSGVFVFQVYYPSKALEYWVDPCLDFFNLGRHVWICLFVLKGSFLFSLRASCLQAQLSCIVKL